MKMRKEFADVHPRASSLPTSAAEDSALIVVEPHGELMNRVVSILDQARAYAQRSPEIRHKACDELSELDQVGVLADLSASIDEDAEQLKGFSPNLSWSHYRSLSMVEHRAERSFYEIEAERCHWSQPALERQIHSNLFARLLKSRDKAGMLKLASAGQTVERPMDVIKHPYVLDFLDLPDAPRLHESALEAAIIEKLQPFLLELGKGFAFVARQHRVSTESQHFYVDLVFYNYLLKCFLLIDLKMGRLTHQDVGQMDMYVRMFDDLRRGDGDNPTVGLILCAERDEVVARYSVLNESHHCLRRSTCSIYPAKKNCATRSSASGCKPRKCSAQQLFPSPKRTRKAATMSSKTRAQHTTPPDTPVSTHVIWHHATVTRARRKAQNGHRGAIIWFTGLSGSGKSTLAHAPADSLHMRGCRAFILDSDTVRHGLCGDLGFTSEDRQENIRR
jgi:predicted nuclease of restriction endonuclease-like (RecB) superfamily